MWSSAGHTSLHSTHCSWTDGLGLYPCGPLDALSVTQLKMLEH